MNEQDFTQAAQELHLQRIGLDPESIDEIFDMTLNESHFSQRLLVSQMYKRLYYDQEVAKWIYYDTTQLRWLYDIQNKLQIKVVDNVNSLLETIDEVVEESELDEDGDKELIKAVNAIKRYVRGMGNKNALNNIISLAQPHMAIGSSDLNTCDDKLITTNGAVNLRDGGLITSSSEIKDLLDTHQVPFKYDESATCPQWISFLNQIFDGDEELIDYVQVLCGYLLTGETSEQAFYFLFGSGANGKGVFLDTIKEIMNDYSCSIRPETINEEKFSSGGNSATPELVKLVGSRLAVVSEGKKGAILNISLVKQFSGENTISIRPLYGSPFNLIPKFKLVIETNHLPSIQENDHATWRRIFVVPFNVTITKEQIDKELRSKLRAEGNGILKWMVDGAVKYYESGFPTSEAVATATEKYRKSSDPFSIFLEMYVEAKDGGTIGASELYKKFSFWAQMQGLESLSTFQISDRMQSLGFKKKRSNTGMLYRGYMCTHEEVEKV